jgi:hypothetical protein
MAQFILFLHEDPAAFADVSPAEMQAIIQKYIAWNETLARKGQLAGGHKLEDGTGRVIRAGVVSDGPYTEAKEVIGGIYLIEASGYDEAVAIARTCPHCEFGTVEVRLIENVG